MDAAELARPDTPFRVVVLSSTRFGRFCLEAGILPAEGIQVAGILTTPPVISISYAEAPVRIATHATFDDLAARAGSEVCVLSGKVNAEAYLEPLRRWQPDLLLALGWYYMVPRTVRAGVPCAGIHASLLPKYRGGAPIPWAILNGEKETGVSFFYLEDGVDCGDLIAQERIPITSEDTCATVYAKAEAASARVLRACLPLLAAGRAPRTPQDESAATRFPQRSPEDGRIDWTWGAARIYDFVRAQTKPYPGAFTTFDGERLTVWAARPSAEPPGTVAPGTVAPGTDRLLVRCGDGWIELLAVETARHGEMGGKAFARRLDGHAVLGSGPPTATTAGGVRQAKQ